MRIEIRPAFDDAIMAAELPIRKAAAKMLTLLQQLDLTQLWNHPGLNFEKLQGMMEPLSGEQLYSLRVTGSARAITCLLKGPTVVLVSLHTQHDKAYRKEK
jgi:hypothetical protein